MRFVIYAYESTYLGEHGVYDICVTEANSIDEVEDIAETLAHEVIDSFSHLFEDEDDCEEGYEPTSPEYEYEQVSSQWDDISTEALDEEAAEIGYEEFVTKYCQDAPPQMDVVGHTVVNNYIVDTCFDGNHYETSILVDFEKEVIVARYPKRAAAASGHSIWSAIAATSPTKIWDIVKKKYILL